jgi:signal peptidase II
MPTNETSPPGSHAAEPGQFRAYARLIVVALASFAADIASKEWATRALQGFDPKLRGVKRIEVWRDHLDFVFAQNPGGAWSFLRSLPDVIRRPFFLVVSLAAIVFMVSLYRRVRPEQHGLRWGLPLALGGALGNLVDRIRHGWVVDFIDVYMRTGGTERHWPTFNVADVAIVLGVGMMALDMLLAPKTPSAEPHPAAAPSPPSS